MKKSRLLGAVCASIFSSISIPSHAALVDNGGGLIYDTVLDITWAQPGTTLTLGYSGVGDLVLGGATEWRLPYLDKTVTSQEETTSGADCSNELACRDNELAYMFYHNLGGTFRQSILTSGDPDLALFPSLQPTLYMSANYFRPNYAWDPGNHYFFDFDLGYSFGDVTLVSGFAWVVHDGNIGASTVPVPAAAWLFGSGLLGLIGVGRKR